MPRQATGNAYETNGRWYARITVDTGKRQSFALPTCNTEPAANERAAVLAAMAQTLRAGKVAPELTAKLLERAGAAAEGKALAGMQKTAGALARGEVRAVPVAAVTFRDVAERWLSGELAREYPDRVHVIKRPDSVRGTLEKHVYSHGFGELPIASFTLDHAETVMRSIPAERAVGTRRTVGQTMHRVLSLAAYPLRLIPANPLPKGFLPKVGEGKVKGSLYPDEDAKLLGCTAVPLCWRLFYGFLHREGPRASEATGFTWPDFDLDRGGIKLDENKTDDPRAWALDSSVVEALRALRAMRDGADPVFVDEDGRRIRVSSARLAEQFRKHLQIAGVDRAELFERSKARRPIRLHDTRATFITIALANGKTETWVADRTGHKSSDMINRYRRAARTIAELNLGPLRPMTEAIPELAAKGGRKGSGKGSEGGGNSEEKRQKKAYARVDANSSR